MIAKRKASVKYNYESICKRRFYSEFYKRREKIYIPYRITKPSV